MAERDAREPVDADVDVLRRFLAARDVEVAPARCAAADEDRVVLLGEQLLERRDVRAAAELDAEVEDVADLLVDDLLREPELRDLAADHAARLRVAVVDDDLVAERREVARDGEGRGAGADAGDALAVLLRGALRQPPADVFFVVGGDALQSADRDRLLRLAVLDAAAPAGGLAGPVAGASEDAREDVRPPVDHVRIAVAAGGDQPDVFGDGGMGRAGPLTIDDLVKVIGTADVGRFHSIPRHSPVQDVRSSHRAPASSGPRQAVSPATGSVSLLLGNSQEKIRIFKRLWAGSATISASGLTLRGRA